MIDNSKLFILNEVLASKYTVLLLQDGSATGNYRLSIQIDRGTGYGFEEVASVPYTNMLIDGIDPTITIINSPTFYGEFSANNCEDFTYNFITNALK